MSTKITVYKHWITKDGVAYHIECAHEVDKADKIPKTIGELLGSVCQQSLKPSFSKMDRTTPSYCKPPIRTIAFDAPATKGQMRFLRKAAIEHLKNSDEAAIISYLKALFGVSNLMKITRGMAAAFLTDNQLNESNVK